MKKMVSVLLACMMMASLVACNGNSSKEVSTNETEKEITTEEEAKADAESIDEIPELIEKDIADTLTSLNQDYEQLKADVDTYDKYVENTDKMEAFYQSVLKTQQKLTIRMREYCLDYADFILSSDSTFDDKYDEFDEMFDVIYEDAGDEIFDEIYEGLFADIYDDFYDGILSDAYDTVPYKEWSDTHSDEYDLWSDTHSDLYDDWSDFHSDVYDFWSDMKGEMWDDDLEKAREKMDDFREDIDKLKKELNEEEESETEETSKEDVVKKKEGSAEKEKTSSGKNTSSKTKEDTELVDGMRPEFKEAMDSYEEFYDEYCDFMKKYNSDPTDTELLKDYSTMMTKLADMDEKFKAWEEKDLNTKEQKYYLEVNNRILQKLVEVEE